MNPPLSEVEDVIDAIDRRDLEKLSELLDDENVNITKLYLLHEYIDLGWSESVSILGYALYHTRRWPRAEVIALLIEKKNPDLTLPTMAHDDGRVYFFLLERMSKIDRIIFIAHLVNDIDISLNGWLGESSFPSWRWKSGGLDWQTVGVCYRRLKSDATARVMDPDWYKKQTFERRDEEGKLKYSKECHLAWAIAYLLLHYGGMKNLMKWGIAHAVALMDESHEMGIKRALGRTPPPRFALLKY